MNTPKGKYQKILAKKELSYDDLLVLSKAKKIKGMLGPFVAVRHNGENYLKLTDPEKFKYLLEKPKNGRKPK